MHKHNNWLLLGVLIVLGLINWHYYNFYQNNFREIYSVLNLRPTLNNQYYEEGQKYHPFYDLYLASINNNYQKVYFFQQRYDEKDSLLEDELFIRINYFFYPKIIIPIRKLKDWLNLKLNSGDLIISDINLKEDYFPGKNLKPIPVKNVAETFQDYFFRREKPYYLFEVQ